MSIKSAIRKFLGLDTNEAAVNEQLMELFSQLKAAKSQISDQGIQLLIAREHSVKAAELLDIAHRQIKEQAEKIDELENYIPDPDEMERQVERAVDNAVEIAIRDVDFEDEIKDVLRDSYRVRGMVEDIVTDALSTQESITSITTIFEEEVLIVLTKLLSPDNTDADPLIAALKQRLYLK